MTQSEAKGTAAIQKHVGRVAASTVAGLASIGAVVFWPAGTFAWPHGWLFVTVVIANFGANLAYLVKVNPGLIVQRTQIGPGTKRWDIVWAACFGPLFCTVFVIAGFDAVRYGWSSMASWWWVVGIALFLPGTALLSWSMGVNPFFEKTVRIQSERGHRVIDSGPYRYARHPGYVGLLGWCLATPLLLGSWWAFLPALACCAGVGVRTALEDRTLRAELTGYEAYAQRVRFRLLPGLW